MEILKAKRGRPSKAMLAERAIQAPIIAAQVALVESKKRKDRLAKSWETGSHVIEGLPLQGFLYLDNMPIEVYAKSEDSFYRIANVSVE